MSQRNSHRHITEDHRPPTMADVPRLGGKLITTLVLVLLITNGGAG